MLSAYFIFILTVALVVAIVALSIVITPQNTVRVVETFGKYAGQRSSGLTFKLPWPFQTASAPINLRTQQVRETVGVMSSDKAFVMVPISVQFRIDPRSVYDAYYKLDRPVSQIQSYLNNSVRATASGKTFSELFQSRDAFRHDIEETLKEKMDDYGYIIVDVLVDDPQPSEEVVDSFNRVIASERLREAAENEGEAEKIRMVKSAEAEKASLELRGEALATFRQTIAKGNAEAVEAFVGKTGLGAKDALAFMTSVNEMEQLSQVASEGGRVIFIGASAAGGATALDPGMLAAIEAAIADTRDAKTVKPAAPRVPQGARQDPGASSAKD